MNYKVWQWWFLLPMVCVLGSWVAACKSFATGQVAGTFVVAGVGIVFLAMLIAAWALRYVGKPNYDTSQNVDVFLQETISWTSTMKGFQGGVNQAIENALVRWGEWGGKPEVVRAYMGKGQLHFVSYVMDDGVGGHARGLTSGNYMSVTCRKPPSPEDLGTVMSLVEHEAGHVCLNALHVPEAQQHAIMDAVKAP